MNPGKYQKCVTLLIKKNESLPRYINMLNEEIKSTDQIKDRITKRLILELVTQVQQLIITEYLPLSSVALEPITILGTISMTVDDSHGFTSVSHPKLNIVNFYDINDTSLYLVDTNLHYKDVVSNRNPNQ